MYIRNTAAAVLLAGLSVTAMAAPVIPYPSFGTENPTMYSFTATADGPIVGYFAGSAAGGAEAVEMVVNGVVSPNGFGLIWSPRGGGYTSSAVGASFNMGNVHAGDKISFLIDVYSTGQWKNGDLSDINSAWTVYSDAAKNIAPTGADYLYNAPNYAGNGNHIYSQDYTMGDKTSFGSIPSGVYVAFEDQLYNRSDFNYFDMTFVFTNVGVATVPEPASAALIGMGLLGLAGPRLRRRG